MLADWLVTAIPLALAGAMLMPTAVFVAIKLNYKGTSSDTPQIPKDRRFYTAMALFGGGAFAALATLLFVLDHYDVRDPWLRGGLLLLGAMLVSMPVIIFLMQHGSRTSDGGA